MVLLGLATVGSAWCGYQASRWNGEEAERSRLADTAQLESSRLFGRATQTIAYDATGAALYAAALVQADERLVAFYRDAIVRPEFLPTLDAWKDQVAAGERPTNLLADQDYLDGLLEPARAQDTVAAEARMRSSEAAEHADAYILTTLFMASALFFAGVTSSFRSRVIRIVLLGASATAIAFSTARLVDLPVI